MTTSTDVKLWEVRRNMSSKKSSWEVRWVVGGHERSLEALGSVTALVLDRPNEPAFAALYSTLVRYALPPGSRQEQRPLDVARMLRWLESAAYERSPNRPPHPSISAGQRPFSQEERRAWDSNPR